MRVLWIVAALMFAYGPAHGADDYPSRPVRLVVGYGAGGSVDIPARYIADKLSAALGQRVIVENKPGAAGMLAAKDVLAQAKDGHHLLLCTHFEPINTVLYKTVPYKLSDFAPISLITKYYYGLAVANATPADTFEQFVDYAKARPGVLNYATVGAGSAQEILARQLERLVNITMNKIPFRGGPQIAQELIAGRIDLYIAPTLAVVAPHQSKQLKIIAVSSPDRLASLPSVPTLRERGVDFVRFGWLGICAGSGTPQAVIDLLHRHITTIVATDEYRTIIESGGQLAVSSTPDDLALIMAQTVDSVSATIAEFGLQQD
jgi:tripartite-type tricarboxylate transporter receptor subunit TctC